MASGEELPRPGNTPGKIPITQCTSERLHLEEPRGPIATITACQAADCSSSHVYREARAPQNDAEAEASLSSTAKS